MNPNLEHFIRLAKQGKHGGCSGSEFFCRKLALLAIRSVVGFDASAIKGLKDFIDLASDNPQVAAELLNGKGDTSPASHA